MDSLIVKLKVSEGAKIRWLPASIELYESLSRRGPKTSAFKQRLFTCSLYTLSLIKVLYTLERLVLIMNIEIRPRVSWSPTAG